MNNCETFIASFGEINYVQTEDGVSSVNGKTGEVVINANDVGAIPVSEKGAANGVATLDGNGKLVQLPSATDVGAIPASAKGANDGVATLDSRGRLVQMPDADDVGAIDISEKGEPYGVATLDENGRVVQLPPLDIESGIPEAEKGAPFGVATLDGSARLVQMPSASEVGAVPAVDLGQPLGVATLDSEGYVVQPVRGGGGGGTGAVSSVNGQTGQVVLTAADVGARPDTWTPSPAEIGAIPTSEKGAPNGVPVLDASGKLVGYVSDYQGIVSDFLNIKDNIRPNLILTVVDSNDAIQSASIVSADANSISVATGIQDSALQRGITLYNSLSGISLGSCFILNDGATPYIIYGQHNKPSGSYVGDSSYGNTVSLGFGVIVNAVVITKEGGEECCIVTKTGSFVGSPDYDVLGWYSNASSARILTQDGEVILRIGSTEDWINANGATYNWQVI